VLATRVKRAHKLHGQKLIVADLREHELARTCGRLPAPQAGNGPGLASRRSPAICSKTVSAHDDFLRQW